MYKFQWLNSVDTTTLLSDFNRSFADYQVPMQLTLEQFERKLLMDNVIPALSVGTYHNDELIGFVLFGKNEDILYNSATGILPLHRGHHLTQEMYHWALPHLEKDHKEIRLEVLTENIPAIKSYENVGFEKYRVVTCYKGSPTFPDQKGLSPVIKETSYEELIQLQQHFEEQPTWQNKTSVFEKFPEGFRHWTLYVDNHPAGFVSVQTFNSRVVQLFILPAFRNQGWAKALLHHVTEELGPSLYFINVDDRDEAFAHLLTKLGLEVVVKQFEMIYSFKKKGEISTIV